MNIQNHYDSVKRFNKIAGNLDNVGVGELDGQLSITFEEFAETITALEEGDEREFLDGIVDCFVTISGLMQMAEAAGFNVDVALERICKNNLEKYPSAGEKIVVSGDLTVTKNGEYNVWVLKDQNGKVKKPPNFVSVDLEGLYPKNFFVEGV